QLSTAALARGEFLPENFGPVTLSFTNLQVPFQGSLASASGQVTFGKFGADGQVLPVTDAGDQVAGNATLDLTTPARPHPPNPTTPGGPQHLNLAIGGSLTIEPDGTSLLHLVTVGTFVPGSGEVKLQATLGITVDIRAQPQGSAGLSLSANAFLNNLTLQDIDI